MRCKLQSYGCPSDSEFSSVVSRSIALIVCAGLALLASAAFAEENALPDGATQEWVSRIRQDIADSEYRITWQETHERVDVDEAWQAPNRAHGFRTYFTDRGIRVIPRDERADSWEWGLSLIGYGRGGTVWAIRPATLNPDESGIDYDRGEVAEWYVNSRDGLKQGFALHEAPERAATLRADGSALFAPGGRTLDPDHPEDFDSIFIVLELTGSLSPAISTDGQAIDFRAPGGANAIHYASLRVTDATGRELPAEMEGFAEAGTRGIRIVVDDENAFYPITIDPLATSDAWRAYSGQAGSGFGISVATAGDVNADGYSDIIVGADSYDGGLANEGGAFVYYGSASGPAATASWSVTSGQADAYLGVSVSTAGDVDGDGFSDVIVGAQWYDGALTDSGGVFVYHGSASGLDLTGTCAANADWCAESGQGGSRYGRSASTAGDVNGDGYSDVVVGAWFYDTATLTEAGRVYVYHGSSGGLSTTPNQTVDGDQASGRFGSRVATAGDVNGDGYSDVAVGAYVYTNPEGNEGRAYVFYGSSSGMSASSPWTMEINEGGARFGSWVATAGDVNGDGYGDVIVGANLYNGGVTDQGGAWVYHGSATGPSSSADWSVVGGVASAKLGVCVGTAGDVNGDGYADVIVGAFQYENPQTIEGRALVYLGSASGLETTSAWDVESNQAGAQYGIGVATAGDVNGDGYSDVIVGSNLYNGAETDDGAAFVYLGSAEGLDTGYGWNQTEQSGSGFGSSVATAGDVNGDGYADVIVGAPDYDNGSAEEGMAFVYTGSPTGLATSAGWTVGGDQAYAHLGSSVASAGDVNGDGYDDVILGAPDDGDVTADEGRARVFHGSATGLSVVEDWSDGSEQTGADFGASVASAGDVNGDGYSDVIIGSPGYDGLVVNDSGAAFVYLGSATGLGASASWSAEGAHSDSRFGISVAAAGDVDRDGYSDIIVGADQYSGAEIDEGQALVYHGSSAGPSPGADWTAESNQASALFGHSVAGAGDVNGDGYSDVVVGAPGFDVAASDEGRAWIYHGSSTGLPGVASQMIDGGPGLGLGYEVAAAGDVNGDGFADVVVVVESGPQPWVYHGSAAGLSTTRDWQGPKGVASAAGDVNGDGYADLIHGWRAFDTAFLYHGGGGGVALRAEQRRSDDTAPIARLGASSDLNEFSLGLLGRTPYGRGLVKLEWEVKQLGTNFDGTSTAQSSSWSDSGTGGIDLDELAGLGDACARYHWRARLRYHPATTPFQQTSRWLTVPWDGWNEADLVADEDIDGDMTGYCSDGCLDMDGDGYGDPGGAGNTCTDDDCDDSIDQVWALPGEAEGLVFTGKSILEWNAPADPGGTPTSPLYDTIRSDVVTMGGPGAYCVETDDGPDTTSTDSNDPGNGVVWYYLIRAENSCGQGPLGNGRTAPNCPLP